MLSDPHQLLARKCLPRHDIPILKDKKLRLLF